jgi:hypothetical protein
MAAAGAAAAWGAGVGATGAGAGESGCRGIGATCGGGAAMRDGFAWGEMATVPPSGETPGDPMATACGFIPCGGV